jgi:hypothetical protein
MKKIVNAALGLSVLAGCLASSASAHAFYLKNYATNMCMGVAAGTPTAGTKFIQWPCDRSANQTFGTQLGVASTPASSVTPGSSIGLFNAVAWAKNSIVDISSSTAADGTNVILGFWSGGARQTWRVDDTYQVSRGGMKCYRFINATSSNEAMGVSGGSTQQGAQIITWRTFPDYWNHYDQFWCPVDNV